MILQMLSAESGVWVAHSESLLNVHRLANFERGGFGHLCAELSGELVSVVGEYSRFLAGSGDGDAAEAGTE